MPENSGHIIKLLILAILLACGKISQAQNYGIKIGFVQDNTSQTIEEVASNVLKIVNYTNTSQDVVLSFSLPDDGWEIIGETDRGFRLAPNDSFFVPVRIIPNKNSKGNTNYIASAYLSSKGIQIGFALWNISIDKISAWHAITPDKKIYFSHSSDTAYFRINVQNTGNSEEKLVLNLNPPAYLIIYDSAGTRLINEPQYFSLAVNETRYFHFMVLRRSQVVLPTDQTDNDNLMAEKYGIKINIRNQKLSAQNAHVWNGTINFIKLQDELKIYENGYSSIPLSMEFNTYSLLNKNAYSTLDLYGHAMLPKRRMLTYYFQTPFNSNYFNAQSFLGRYHYIGYDSDKLSLGIGSVSSGKSFSNLSGIGARAEYKIKKHKIGGIYVRSPQFSNSYYLSGYGGSYTYISDRILIDNYYQRKDNLYSKVNSNLYTTFTSFRINNHHTIRGGFGYSTEDHYWNPDNKLKIGGYHYRLLYNGKIKKLTYNFVNYYGSKNYAEFRGIFSASFNTIYNLNENNVVSLAGTHLQTDPEYYKHGELISVDNYSRKDLISFKYILNKEDANYIFNPYVQYYDYLQLQTLTKSLGIDYKLRGSNNVKLYATAIGGYVKALDFDSIPNFFVANLRASVRVNKFSSNFRYYYGPYFTREQLDFIEDGVNPQRLFISMYHDKWFKENHCLLKSNLSYNYSTLYKRSLLSTRPELFYYTEKDFRFSIYMRFSLFAENPEQRIIGDFDEGIGETDISSKFEVGFGVKKDIGLPLSFRKYNDLKIIVFKDVNGNGKQDINEQGLKDMLITIQQIDSNNLDFGNELTIDYSDENFELVTNSKGKVVFNNLACGDYKIKTTPLNGQAEWFDNRKFTTVLDRDKTILIPLSKGAKVTGGLFIDREKFSHFGEKLNLSNIRVTAVDSFGKTYSALTDATGNFAMYLPSGGYTITCNEAALGDRFQFMKNNIPVVLTNDIENYSVSFFIIEKRRTIQVKKFDKHGNLVKSSGDTEKNDDPSAPRSKSIPLEKQNYIGTDDNGSGQLPSTNISKEENKVLLQTDPNMIQKVDEIDEKVEKIENVVKEINQKIDELEKTENKPAQTISKYDQKSPEYEKPIIIKKNIVEIPKDQLGDIEDGEFYIIIGAYKLPENALRAVDIWKRKYKSYSPLIIHNEVRNWYYVCIETHTSFKQASIKNKDLKRRRVDNWIYFLDQENNLKRYKN